MSKINLPPVLSIDGVMPSTARLIVNNQIVVAVDLKAVERVGADPLTLTRLLAVSPQVLELLMSAMQLISDLGLDWPRAGSAEVLVNWIENPNTVEVEYGE